MEEMIEQEVKNYSIQVESFWKETPLPEKMSLFMKCLLRVVQLYFIVWKTDGEVADLMIDWKKYGSMRKKIIKYGL